jgi:hypothetical protein
MSQDTEQTAEWSDIIKPLLDYQMVKCAVWSSIYQKCGREHHNKQEIASKPIHQANRSLLASVWAFIKGIMKFQRYVIYELCDEMMYTKFPTYLSNLEQIENSYIHASFYCDTGI